MARARGTAIAIAAVAAVLASPLAGAAVGAPAAFSGTDITTSPPPDSNNVVHANRPEVSATFSQSLNPSKSSITLVEKGKSTNLCTSFQVSGSTVSCTPAEDLALDKTYDAVGHGVNSSGAKASTKQLEFTVSYPKFEGDKSTPIPDGSIVTSGTTLVAQFDQAVAGNTDTFAADGAFKVFELNPDGSQGTQLPGTVKFPTKPTGGSDGTVTFDGSMGTGKYEADVLVHSSGSTAAVGSAHYYFWVAGTAAPTNLKTTDPYANNVNSSAFAFTGNAAPGLTVTVLVIDNNDPSGGSSPTNPKGSAVVAACDTAPSCPWEVDVDVSSLQDGEQNVKWVATASDGSNDTDSGNTGNPFTVDRSAPPQPNVTAKDPHDGDSTVTDQVTVSASYAPGTDTSDVDHYHITISDPDGNVVEQDAAAASDKTLPETIVDVTTLNDGKLTVQAQAEDIAGNRSDYSNPLDGPPTVTKKAGLLPNLGTSTLTSQGVDTAMTDAETHAVHSPATVTLEFTQSIKLSYTDYTNSGGPKKHGSVLCVATTQGNCVTGVSPSLSDDGRGLVISLSSDLADRTYELRATTYSKNNCPDHTPDMVDPTTGKSTWSCEMFPAAGASDIVTDQSSGQPFTFTVDNTPPTVTVANVSPDPIHSDGVDHVTVSGTVSPDATALLVGLKSSGGKAFRIAQATISQQSTGDATWTTGPLNLSALPDGTLRVTAKAKDSAGNVGTGKGKAKLAAHESKLNEFASSNRVVYGHSVTVKGRLKDQNGDPIVSATITVQPRYDNGKLGKPQTARTDSKGRWSTLEAPTQNATFDASYAGTTSTPVHDAAQSHHARVLVHAFVKITAPKGGSVGSPVKVKGKVKPIKKHEVVALYRKTSHGKVLVGKDRLNNHSKFAIKAALPRGTVTIFAKIGKTEGNLPGKSAKVSVHVS